MPASQSLPRLIALLALAAAAALAGLMATDRLPGFSGENAGAREQIERALSSEGGPKNGRFQGSVSMQLEGAPAQLGAFSMQMSGSFAEAGANRSRFTFDGKASFGSEQVEFGALSTGRKAFVRLGGNHYEVPRSQLAQFGQAGDPAAGSPQALAALGVEPRAWLENARHEGSEVVAGVETNHLSADLDVERMFEDLVAIASRVAPSGTPRPSSAEMEQVKDAVKEASVDVYVGKQDGIARRVSLHAVVEADGGRGTIDADFTVAELRKPPQVSAPANARPFSALERDLRSGGLGALVGPGAAAVPSAPSPPAPAPAEGAPAEAPTSGASPAQAPPDEGTYLGCVRAASTPDALQRCSSMLP